MPCDQYELHLQNSVVGPNGNPDVAVARLDQSTSKVTAVQLGHINVVLDHKSILQKNCSLIFNIYLIIFITLSCLGFCVTLYLILLFNLNKRVVYIWQ